MPLLSFLLEKAKVTAFPSDENLHQTVAWAKQARDEVKDLIYVLIYATQEGKRQIVVPAAAALQSNGIGVRVTFDELPRITQHIIFLLSQLELNLNLKNE